MTLDQLLEYANACIRYGRFGEIATAGGEKSLRLFQEMDRLQLECRKIEVPEWATHFASKRRIETAGGDSFDICWSHKEIPK